LYSVKNPSKKSLASSGLEKRYADQYRQDFQEFVRGGPTGRIVAQEAV